jgi:hypothetical protein
MKRLLTTLLALCLLVAPIEANPWLVVLGQPAAGGGPTYWLSETFEGTGTPAGWSIVEGTPNFDFTTSPLSGAQHLEVGTWEQALFTAAADHASFTFVTIWRPDSLNIGTPFIDFRNSSGEWQLRVFRDSAGILKVYHGDTINDFGGVYEIGTAYYLWVVYSAQVGSGDGVATLHIQPVASGATRPSASLTISTGTGGAVRQVLFSQWTDGGGPNHFDNPHAADSDFTVAP